MPLPPEIQRLCDQYLTAVRADPQHELSAIQRFHIYHSFYPGQYLEPLYFVEGNGWTNPGHHEFLKWQQNNIILADYALGWLEFLSALKVLPFWERAWEQMEYDLEEIVTPGQLLGIAEDFLQHKISIETVFEEKHKAFDFANGVVQDTTAEVASVFQATYDTLSSISTNHTGLKIAFTEGKVRPFWETDVVDWAATAYSVTDKNPPGVWYDKEMETPLTSSDDENSTLSDVLATANIDFGAFTQAIQEFANALTAAAGEDSFSKRRKENLKNFIPLEYDLQKRLEFWEWWLTEAVPQAWELGEQSWSGVIRQV